MELINDKKRDIVDSYYPYLVAFFCSIVILGNIFALKISSFLSLITPSGMICFPYTFSILDIITEVYGEKAASRTIKAGLIILFLYFLMLRIVTNLTPSPDWHLQHEWENIFSASSRIVFGTFIAYYLGEKINTKLLSILKYVFNKKYFLRRSLASTFMGVSVDTVVFNLVAFYGIFSFDFLLWFTLHQLVLKWVMEITGSWVASRIVTRLKNYEQLDPVKPRAWIDKYLRAKKPLQ